MSETVIKIENLKKQYTLGAIGGYTLTQELNSWWAKVRGKENPYSIIGEDTSKYGEKFNALDGINLEIKKGETVGVIGTNGAGKSTLLKILSRVTAPTEGTVCINGRITSMLEVGTGFHPELTGRENIYMNGAILGMTKAEIDEKIEEIIEFSECRQFIDTPVKRYSSGMYVKLAFSVAAHLDSDIMIMDEVLAVGDVKFQKKCLGKMEDGAHVEGKTVLYVSHNMATIRQLCSRCVVLNHGRIIYDGDVEEAIRIYSGIDNMTYPVNYDMSEVKRPSFDHGSQFRLTSLRFMEKEAAMYLTGEKMKLQFAWTAKKRFDNLHLLITVMTLDDQIAGSSYSEMFTSTTIDEENVIQFEFNIENLVEGTYKMILDVQEINEFGSYTSFDHPLVYPTFIVGRSEDQDGPSWPSRYYGLIRMNKLTII
ncbi:ABC transporter [Pseudobutyrivibrio sp. UC1225]|uniref:ABC transporter ATP-binding protein n=1 Tax=Pseudobutyrivibrio sp. UC1225 TaxID=1798185 RepID=UPI0008E28FA4|nr:ABC transporter ATP-binding protein [Pseudobutyrivibrio sp. UC1225]SFO22155.1 ABC transporter [Pseudobutyrivibrio sp. UC1225]